MVVFLFGPCTWEPGRGVPGCRGGPRPLVVLLFGLIHRDFHWKGPIFRFTFSPAQWASPQLNGPVQLSSDRDSWLTGPYWPVGRRRKKKDIHSRRLAGSTKIPSVEVFFVASAFRPVWPLRCDLSFICIPQSTRALDQGGVEPRQAVSPKALRPWTIPLRYSVG